MRGKSNIYLRGAKERGLTGIGSVFGSIGATHVDSNEKLCPQYMLRTDDLEYHLRPLDKKHAVLLPVGQEGEFKISKNVLELRVVNGEHKPRRYQVVAMRPIDHSETPEIEGARMKYDGSLRPITDKPTAEKVPPTNRIDQRGPVSRLACKEWGSALPGSLFERLRSK
jgi:hypothetical protein